MLYCYMVAIKLSAIRAMFGLVGGVCRIDGGLCIFLTVYKLYEIVEMAINAETI